MPRYQIELQHPHLNKYRCLTGSDPGVLQERARAIFLAWEEQWQKRLAAESRRHEQESQRLERDAKKQEALDRTREAEQVLAELKRILAHTLSVSDAIDWEALKRTDRFSEPRPEPPAPMTQPHAPKPSAFRPKLRLVDYLIPGWKAKRATKASDRFDEAYVAWQETVRRHQRRTDELTATFKSALRGWDERKFTFEEEKAAEHAAVEDLRVRYHAADAAAVEEYCDIVLSRSHYPEMCPQEFELQYDGGNKTLVVEYRLPSPDDIPTLKEVRYVQSRDEFKEAHISGSQLNELFDSICLQICLRTIHELIEADVVHALEAIVFNGWVDYIDKATGHETKACILSLQVSNKEFATVNLAAVEPKTCFRKLKGVSSARLYGLAPVPPILRMTRHDPRFVDSKEVASTLEERANLATIEWSEFEHLIREVFEAQFRQSGGEVKVTQASRDGGVDAIVFDPDPIRGGKIVIQAKRYTNPVGVSAVRDLYGTVMNEGAIKGILVTTSNYGPDAYKFAKDKPLTLIDGSNLLHLMAALGHEVRIDLREAKQLSRT